MQTNYKFNFKKDSFISILPEYRLADTYSIPFSTKEDLLKIVSSKTWTHGIFYKDSLKDNSRYKKFGHRDLAHFSQTSLLVAEVDEGWTRKQAENHFKDYEYIIGNSKSHLKDKNGVIAERFRIILFLKTKIYDTKIYNDTWKSVFQNLPVDPKPSHAAGFWNPCSENAEFRINEGIRITPIEYSYDYSKDCMVKENVILAKDKFTKGRRSFKVNYQISIKDDHLKVFGKMNKDVTTRFCQMLLSNHQLQNKFNLGINNICATLNCSTMQASRLLRKACDSGLLILLDKKTIVGVKSRTYCFGSLLKKEYKLLLLLKEKYKLKNYIKSSINITNTCECLSIYGGRARVMNSSIREGDAIKDGHANDSLLYVAHKCGGNEQTYWKYVLSLKGVHKKDRLKQAKRVIYYYNRRSHLYI